MSNDTVTAKKWHSGAGVQFPKDTYLCKCLEEEVGQTQKGAPKFQLNLEIHSPEVGSVAGVDYEVVGTKLFHNQYLKSVNEDGTTNEEKTNKMLDMTGEFYEKWGMVYNRQPDNPNLGFKGQWVWVIVESEEVAQRKNPTPEQLKFGKPGDIMKHPKTGEDMVKHVAKVSSFVCAGDKPGADALA